MALSLRYYSTHTHTERHTNAIDLTEDGEAREGGQRRSVGRVAGFAGDFGSVVSGRDFHFGDGQRQVGSLSLDLRQDQLVLLVDPAGEV